MCVASCWVVDDLSGTDVPYSLCFSHIPTNDVIRTLTSSLLPQRVHHVGYVSAHAAATAARAYSHAKEHHDCISQCCHVCVDRTGVPCISLDYVPLYMSKHLRSVAVQPGCYNPAGKPRVIN
ncbi:hypothetical protein HPB50_001076 [Hyalomma asiaticum]|uniref:Uncharacterized protein n=1 Tax=Hyalomma asiaticum TaxID=266040 RepID=A0ACB7RRB3_HYAAI|nr:hypothetical protein HPB50_001076 [Hyalomma asiaticum]